MLDRSHSLLPGVLVLMGTILTSAPAAAQTVTSPRVLFDVDGTLPSAAVGQRVAGIGDFNDDGVPDFAVGIPNYGPTASDSTGRVLVWFGGVVPHATPDLVLEGQQRGARFGAEVLAAGDVNGDGVADLLVTAPRYSYASQTNRSGSGRAYVYFGGARPAATPAVVLDSPVWGGSTARNTGFGARACALGDIDRDGFGDLAFVCDGSNKLEIFRGGRPMPAESFLQIANPGWGPMSVCGPGDLNGDGYADLLVATTGIVLPTRPNCLLLGFLGLRNKEEATVQYAASPLPGFGSTLVAAGDLNGDGYGEVLVGHPDAPLGGAAWVLFGGSHVLAKLPAPVPAPDSFGTSLAAGDIDGDGRPEILVGAPGTTLGGPGAGAVYVYRFDPFPNAVRSVWTGQPGDDLGYDLAVPGDLDGNGVAEIVVGSPRRDAPVQKAGRVQLLSFAEHVLTEPVIDAEWRAGGRARVRWRGAAPARLALSYDAGVSWSTLADGIGGADSNETWVDVPDTVAVTQLRITTAGADPGIAGGNACRVQIVRDAAASPAAPVVVESLAGPPGARRYGGALAAGVDLDRDGAPDLAIGAPADGAPASSGSVTVRWGGRAARPDLVLHGENPGDRFGAAVAMGGDVDRDGRPDLLVGAPDARGAGGAGAGRAFLWLNGGTGAPTLALEGDREGEGFGSAVALGDFNADGYADLAIASPGWRAAAGSGGAGRVRIWLGGRSPDATPDYELDPPAGTVAFGATMTTVDLNIDGRTDLVVSCTASNGAPDRVFVYYGRPAFNVRGDLVLRGEHAGDAFGAALANAGDPNHDGCPDLLVGAPLARNARGGTGRAYLFSGAANPGLAPAKIFEGGPDDESFGAAVAGVGDLNRDGCDDVAIGAPGASGAVSHSGVVRVFYGSSDFEPDLEWAGAQTAEWFGAILAGAGDSDRDGRRELLAGAPLFQRAGEGLIGRVERLAAPRWSVDEPAPGAAWFAGTGHTLRWRGAEPARIAISTDAGRTWSELATAAGGAASNQLAVRAPSAPADSVFLRVCPATSAVPAESIFAGPIAIVRATTVDRFDFTLEEDGIHFAWKTTPGLAADGWSAYRLARIGPDGTASPVGPPTAEASQVVPAVERGGTFALDAIDGNGAEVELGRVTLPAAAPGLRAWPVPSTGFAPVRLALFPPLDGSGRTPRDFSLRIFDANGRHVRWLAAGATATRVGELSARWDRRDDEGHAVAAGVYFVRALSRSRGFELERRVVLLR